MKTLLEVDNVSISFDGFKAVKDLSFSIGYNELQAIIGPNGAGKTTLVNHIAHHLGCSSSVSSPTFGIVNELDLEGEPAYHIDLYRIEHLDELAQFGFEEYVSSGNYCFIEWPEVGMPYIPEEHHVITLEQVNENTRKISFI